MEEYQTFIDDCNRFPRFKHNCKIVNNTGKTIYCHIVDDPNRQLVKKVVAGVSGSTTSAGANVEFDLDKGVQITQTTRLLAGEDISINLSRPKVRYLTMAWRKDAWTDDQRVFYIRCMSSELHRGHIYTFDCCDLADPLGIVKDFIAQ